MRSNAEFIRVLNVCAKAMMNGQAWIVVAVGSWPHCVSNKCPLILERLNQLVERGGVPVGIVGFMPVEDALDQEMFCTHIFLECEREEWARQIMQVVTEASQLGLVDFIEFPCVKGGCNGFRF